MPHLRCICTRFPVAICSQCLQRGAWLSRLWREPFKTECQYAADCQPCSPQVQHSIATTSVVSFTSCCGGRRGARVGGWETDQTPRSLSSRLARLARHPQQCFEGKFSPPAVRYLGILPTLQHPFRLALKQQGCFGLPAAQPTAFSSRVSVDLQLLGRGGVQSAVQRLGNRPCLHIPRIALCVPWCPGALALSIVPVGLRLRFPFWAKS